VEAFESFVALTMEAEGLVVSEAVKFPVKVAVPSREGFQTHGFEVDLVGANSRKLVLASVKSFLGSRGVAAEYVTGTSTNQTANRRYAMFNNKTVLQGVIDGACDRYGYKPKQLELRLYAGKFADKHGRHREQIANYLSGLDIGGGKLRLFGLDDVVPRAIELAGSKQYRDNAALVAIKVLDAAGRLAT
jgi:hypothetical protein